MQLPVANFDHLPPFVYYFLVMRNLEGSSLFIQLLLHDQNNPGPRCKLGNLCDKGSHKFTVPSVRYISLDFLSKSGNQLLQPRLLFMKLS